MAVSKPTDGLSKSKNNLKNNSLFQNLKKHLELFLFWLFTLS